MKTHKHLVKKFLVVVFVLGLFPSALRLTPRILSAQAPAAPVYVTLWFDTEDYILPQDDDATKRLAEMLTRLGVRATFKVVGEKARVLEKRGRRDVIAALSRHDIGYHSNTHSQQPTIAVYLQHAGWEDGRAEFYRREAQGVRDVQRIFGVAPVAYGQPGSAWAPQTYPALRDMGVRMYLDEADHVGIDDQPFYYGGMLNVFKMRSNLARMELSGGGSLADGKARFVKSYERLRASGGGTISIYYHPSEWVHAEFWDGVNFAHGANPDSADWKLPRTRPAVETEKAFEDFEQYVRFIKAQPDARFVTATELLDLYRDRAPERNFGKEDLLRAARAVQQDITFQRADGYALSAADIFTLLTDSTAAFIDRGDLPGASHVAMMDGPARTYVAPTGGTKSSGYRWNAFARAVRDVAGFCRTTHRLPDEVWIGSESLSPADYLATLGPVVESLIQTGKAPADVIRREGRFTADRYVAEDSPALWGWVIFPDGFHAPKIMELARLQAWTLKPAILHR
jgi:peptidoglycan/xylan/chitin deacetylase (PgdA/CDA1 family)